MVELLLTTDTEPPVHIQIQVMQRLIIKRLIKVIKINFKVICMVKLCREAKQIMEEPIGVKIERHVKLCVRGLIDADDKNINNISLLIILFIKIN